jgi:hypothetical protein
MKDFQPWIEVVIFLVGWVAIVAAQKQAQKDTTKTVDGINGSVVKITESIAVLSTKSQVHDEQIGTLRAAVAQQNTSNAVAIDDIAGRQARTERMATKHDKWIAVANNELKRAVPSWNPPVNGD